MSRYNINNNRYQEKEDGSYYAGKSWRKAPLKEKEVVEQYLWYRASNQEYVETTRHPDGCFKCPRCKCHHYVVDNYDFLCDICNDIIVKHDKAKPEQVEGIKLWNKKKQLHWSGNIDSDIVERLQLRDKLITETEGLMFSG